jgi:hypothetical protein
MIKVKDLVNASGAARGWPQTRCDEEYKNYSFLCGFKHNNPCFQGLLLLPTDPDLYMSQYSLAESIWSCATAVGVFAVQFLDAKHLNGFLEEVSPVMDKAKKLFPLLP